MKWMLLLVTSLLLAGCGKDSEVDALKTETDLQKQRIAELSAHVSALEVTVRGLQAKPLDPPPASGPVAPTDTQVAALRRVVARCVQTVRSLAASGATSLTDVYVTFDAYYNPASGRVENNNQYVSQDAVYAFNKCMTAQGWPLH